MKRYKADVGIASLILLCKYFRLDPRELNHIQKTEILYIHKRLVERLNDDAIETILAEVDRLRIYLNIRGKRRSLYHIFHYCQSEHMARYGDYNTDTLQPPVRFTSY